MRQKPNNVKSLHLFLISLRKYRGVQQRRKIITRTSIGIRVKTNHGSVLGVRHSYLRKPLAFNN